MNIFIVLAIIVFLYIIVNFILDSLSKEEEVDAVLIDKNIETKLEENGVVMESYILRFNFLDIVKYFSVSYRVYKKYNINDKGILIYKRNRFVDFKVKGSENDDRD